MGSEIANSIFPVYPTVSLCDSYHQMCFQREEDFLKRLVRGRENGEEGEGEGEDSPPQNVLKDTVDNGWWGCGHKNTVHYLSFPLCECTVYVYSPSIWQIYRRS